MVWSRKKTYRKKRRTYRKKRYFKKRMNRAKRIGKRMLTNKVQQGISMKFQQLIPLTNITPVANNQCVVNISLMDVQNTAAFCQVINFDQLTQAKTNFMGQLAYWDEYTATGVGIKMFPYTQTATTLPATLVASEMFQDENSMWNPTSPNSTQMSVYSNYQTISPGATKSYSRYFPLAGLKKRLNVTWCKSSDNEYFTYQQELKSFPTVSIRSTYSGQIGPAQTYGYCEVTYYIRFRGRKPAT